MTEEELGAVKKHCINPVDSRETGEEKPETLVQEFQEPEDVRSFDGFIRMTEKSCGSCMILWDWR